MLQLPDLIAFMLLSDLAQVKLPQRSVVVVVVVVVLCIYIRLQPQYRATSGPGVRVSVVQVHKYRCPYSVINYCKRERVGGWRPQRSVMVRMEADFRVFKFF